MIILQLVSSSSQKSMIIGSIVIFPKAAYVSSITSFNRKVVLFSAMKSLTCAPINSIGLRSVSNGGS